MKEKTSITLSKDVLGRIDRLAGSKQSRSALIESILRSYLRQRATSEAHLRDLEKLNRAAEELNAEVADVLQYQFRGDQN